MTLLTPPSEPAEPIVLTVPEQPPVVQADQTNKFIEPVAPARQLEISSQAKGFVRDLATFNPNSPEFAGMLGDVRGLAAKEIVAASAGPSRLLERSLAQARSQGGDSSARVAGTLAELRATVSELTPNAADLKGPRKILGFIPGGKKVNRWLQRYESASTQLDAIVKSLEAGKTELQRDNAALQQEQTVQWKAMGDLNDYIVMADKLDEEIAAEVARLRQAGNTEGATALEQTVLFEVRQRGQDLRTQLAVAIQGYMSMGLVQSNNVELIKGVDRARTTTLTALRTAVMVASALDTQKQVMEQTKALKETTEQTILRNSELLRQQTASIHEQATDTAVSVDVLNQAFDNIYATIDAVETYRSKALGVMQENIGQLNTQLERARPQVDRAQALTGGDQRAITR
jgi:uncharacterized protein YaaN involved in tellurite resistance